MRFDDSALPFPYELPEERIAVRPCQQLGLVASSGSNIERSDSRLLVVRKNGVLEDLRFYALPNLLSHGDLLVLNNTRVVPYRFLIETSLGRPYELFLTSKIPDIENGYRALAKPLRKMRPGRVFNLGGVLRAEVLETRREPDPEAIVRIYAVDAVGVEDPQIQVEPLIEQSGFVPIPSYIRGGVSDDLDRAAYQTVYATEGGSIAAPTAGLHFTTKVLEQVRAAGVEVAFLRLDLGPASFLPVRGEISSHRMPLERYCVSRETAAAVIRTKERGGRVIAVGTSSVRTLETLSLTGLKRLAESTNSELTGSTELFITPGFSFTVVDGLITNFHQPGSTHLLLVTAFAGLGHTASAYNHALAGDYRFLSYGDSMVIL